jgi:hypothetical protein
LLCFVWRVLKVVREEMVWWKRWERGWGKAGRIEVKADLR